MTPNREKSDEVPVQHDDLSLLLAVAAQPAWTQGQAAPKYSAKVPASVVTPASVQTRIGTLKFFDGAPR